MEEIDSVLQEEMNTATALPDTKPCVIQLDKNQTPKAVRDMLTHLILTFDKEKTSEVRVIIKGYEDEKKHPALLPNAKKKYAKAIDMGLIGFLEVHGYHDVAKNVYMMAHCRARIKTVIETNAVGGEESHQVLRFSGFYPADYVRERNKSLNAFSSHLKTMPR